MTAKLTTIFVLAVITIVSCEDAIKTHHRHKYEDPFELIDRHMSMALSHDHSLIPQLARQYFWPWTQLAKAVVAFDDEEALEEPHVLANPRKFEIKLDVRRFKPDELKVKVMDQAVIVEGKHVIADETTNKKYIANQFVQRYSLPIGCEPDEVKSILGQNGILTVFAPRHPAPPKRPERIVPIIMEEILNPAINPIFIEKRPEAEEQSKEEMRPIIVTKPSDGEDSPMEQKRTNEEKRQEGESIEESATSDEKHELPPIVPALPVETTTFIGKIRKKELKNATKEVARKIETSKPIENNVLDYVTLDAE